MTKEQENLIIILIVASMLLVVAAGVWCIYKTVKQKRMPEKYNKAGMSMALVFSGFLILAIWALRFAVGYFAILVSNTETQQLTWGEEIVNSLFGALRTFSIEEGYDKYIISIKTLIAQIVPSEHWSFYLVQTVVIVYASLLNLIAPVISGAIILEILSSVFPKIKLRLSYIAFRRTKYFFSELTAASLSLAKSIYSEKKDEKPVLIFTDTYVDDEKEKEYELLLEARQYGAICVRDDLTHIVKPRFGKREYYLIDENEFSNLQELMELTNKENIRYLKDACIYLFVQSDAYVQIEKQINKNFEEIQSKPKKKKIEKPTIIPIHSYRNVVHNLFVDIPLYEPLIHKKDNTKLNVTILGNGLVGTEAVLSAYWFGQMAVSCEKNGQKEMADCDMTISVVSKEEQEAFWSKIDYINPEIRRTTRREDDILAYDANGNLNNPYCSIEYIKADVKMDGFWDSDSQNTKKLLDSDCFIVALGSDEDNISVADKLRSLIGKKHLEGNAASQVVIAYTVFNSKLANTLNRQKHYQCRTKGENDILMYAFGNLEQVYSCDNIYMSKNKLLAEGTGAAYDKVQMRQKHIEDNKNRTNNENKNYSYWSNLARAMHIKYKAFSLGLIKKSIFDYNSDELGLYKSYVEGQCNLYKQISLAKSADDICKEHRRIYNDVELKKQVLAWVEHRRWVAYTRIMGYQYTGEFKRNLELNGESHKNMELKLHPCLVEAKKPDFAEREEYSQKNIQELFVGLDVKFKIDELSVKEMTDLLNKKKEYLIVRNEKITKIKKEELDLLDKLTLEWCEEATRVSIIKIEDELKGLEQAVTELPSEQDKKSFLKAWSGIGCYDFKVYDYHNFDYN